jgi:hypothetical protein
MFESQKEEITTVCRFKSNNYHLEPIPPAEQNFYASTRMREIFLFPVSLKIYVSKAG